MNAAQQQFAREIAAMLGRWPADSDVPPSWRARVAAICRRAAHHDEALARLAELQGTAEREARLWLLMLGDEARFDPTLCARFRHRLWVVTCAWGQPGASLIV